MQKFPEDKHPQLILARCMTERLDIPSIALGLLQSILQDFGIDSFVWNTNLDFIDFLDWDTYMFQCTFDNYPKVMDVLFAQHVFDPPIKPKDEVISYLVKNTFNERENKNRKSYRLFLERVWKGLEKYLDYIMSRFFWPDVKVLAFSTSFGHLSSLMIAKKIKQTFPHIKIILGGVYCDLERAPVILETYPFVDMIFHGEVESVIGSAMAALLNDQLPSQLEGISFRKESGLTFAKEYFHFDGPLDSLPLPDYSDYFSRIEEISPEFRQAVNLPYESSRGCWYGCRTKCLFCGLNFQHMSFRSKMPEKILTDLKVLKEKYHADYFLMVDNVMDQSYVTELLPKIANDPEFDDVELFWQVRSTQSPEALNTLRRAHVRLIQPGIESLNSHTLKIMRKGVRVLHNVQLLKWARQLQIDVSWNILYGFPGETPQDIYTTVELIPLLRHLKPPAAYAIPYLTLQNPLFQEADRFGLGKRKPYEIDHYIYPFEDSEIMYHAFVFKWEYDASDELKAAWRKLTSAIDEWQSVWGEETRGGILLTVDEGENLLIIDTRPVARISKQRLEGEARQLFEYCDRIRSFRNIVEFMARIKSDFSESEIRQMLMEWESLGWILSEGDLFLGLALSLEVWNHNGVYSPENALVYALRESWRLDQIL